MSLCQQLKTEYAQIEKLKQEFDLAFEDAVKTGKTDKAMKLKKEIEEKLKNLKEKIIPKEISATFTNPETNEQKEIKLNLKEQIQIWQEFYQKHNLPIPNEKELQLIWKKNHREMKEEMEKYGYDTILMIPGNLPNTEDVHQKMTEDYNDSWTSNSFDEGGGFSGTKHTENPKTRIILIHNDQDIYEDPNANIFAKQTLNKNIMQLSGLPEAEVEKTIQAQENIPINFEATINNQKVQIQAEGLSLNEYLIFQKQYFEKTNTHLDERGWTWLLKTFFASRVVDSGWSPVVALLVHAVVPDSSDDCLGCRLSRSFSS